MQLPRSLALLISLAWTGAALQTYRAAGGRGTTRPTTKAPRGSQPQGHWECGKATGEDVWQDDNYGAVSSVISKAEVSAALENKWLLIVGDSTVRMTYHFLLGVLSMGWTEWPIEINQHGPTYETDPEDNVPRGCELLHIYDAANGSLCLQDSYLPGGIRLSFLWMDTGEEYQVSPLAALERHQTLTSRRAQIGTPDVLLLSIGAWFITNELYSDLDVNLHARMMDLQRMFPLSHKILASVPNCNKKLDPKGPDTTHDILSNATRNNNHWVFYDRDSVVTNVCDQHKSCKYGWPHPTGPPLNALVRLLLWQVSDAR